MRPTGACGDFLVNKFVVSASGLPDNRSSTMTLHYTTVHFLWQSTVTVTQLTREGLDVDDLGQGNVIIHVLAICRLAEEQPVLAEHQEPLLPLHLLAARADNLPLKHALVLAAWPWLWNALADIIIKFAGIVIKCLVASFGPLAMNDHCCRHGSERLALPFGEAKIQNRSGKKQAR